jgi:glycosyltransferase involved in cell wall biosynthesis
LKVLLVGFKLSVGIEPYLNIIAKNLQAKRIEIKLCIEKRVADKCKDGYGIGLGGNSVQMLKDTLNVLNYFNYAKLLIHEKPTVVFFVSSHPLNSIAILITRIFGSRATIVSQIHDPLPHSGTSYGIFILISQILQCWISDKIIVAGKKLKENIKKYYLCSENKIHVMPLGTFREERSNSEEHTEEKIYIPTLGRIEDYKGIDVFLKSAGIILHMMQDKGINYKFLIAGSGDLQKYSNLIEKIPQKYLEIKNYIISDEEFDDILKKSYVCVLPYKDGTQSGTTAISYYNACPVIVSNVGSLPEYVQSGETGYVVEPNNPEQLAEKITFLLENNNLQRKLANQSYSYYKENFRWSNITNTLVSVFKE